MLCAQTEFARLLPACLWPYLVNLRRLASLALLDPLHAMMSAMLAIVGMSLTFHYGKFWLHIVLRILKHFSTFFSTNLDHSVSQSCMLICSSSLTF